jgi:hypothetical protein
MASGAASRRPADLPAFADKQDRGTALTFTTSGAPGRRFAAKTPKDIEFQDLLPGGGKIPSGSCSAYGMKSAAAGNSPASSIHAYGTRAGFAPPRPLKKGPAPVR